MVRHGESTWNAVRRWQGRADPPLSELGEQQAELAIDRARSLGPFDTVVTSSLERARRTGQVLAAGLGHDEPRALPGLDERGAGVWEGLTRIEIEERDPGFLAAGRRPDGYELDDAVIQRVLPTVLGLAADVGPGRTVLLVAHGGVIGVLAGRHIGGWERMGNLDARWFDVTADDAIPTSPLVSLLPDGEHAEVPSSPGYA